MPFTARLVGSYLIFFIGSQVIYYGTKLNGGDHPRSPVWHFVRWFHDFMNYGTLAMFAAAFVMFILIPLILSLIQERIEKAEKEAADKKYQEVLERRKHDYDRYKQEQSERIELETTRIEEQKILNEKKEQEMIKARNERSAADAARAGLDDFL